MCASPNGHNRPVTPSGHIGSRAFLLGAEGAASDAEAFARLLKLAQEQVNRMLHQSPFGCLARLAALCRLDGRVVWFLPKDVVAWIGPLGPTRPHAVNGKARVREAVVHAVLLLELQGELTRTEGSINRNMWKIERIASDFLTEDHRSRGGTDKVRLGPEPVGARTIQWWLREYENDLAWGLCDKAPRRPRRANLGHRDHGEPMSSPSTERGTASSEVPDNVVPLPAQGQVRSAKFVPWWMRDHS